MEDLVERLRGLFNCQPDKEVCELMEEAADRIEFLEGTVKTNWVNWEELWAHSEKQKDRIEVLEGALRRVTEQPNKRSCIAVARAASTEGK